MDDYQQQTISQTLPKIDLDFTFVQTPEIDIDMDNNTESDMFDDDNSDIDNENDAVKMKTGDSFNNWDTVQRVVDSYAKQHGFVARKCRKDLDAVDKSIIRRQVYSCWKSGVNK